MQHEERHITSSDGLKLYLQVWKPKEEPKGIIQIIHGLGEHSNRYTNVINTLVPAGYIIYACDLRGHGKSEGPRMFVNKFDEYIKDQQLISKIIQEDYPEKPKFLLGHSLGSTIAELFDNLNSFNGLILSASGMRPGGSVPSILVKLSAILAKIFPKLKVSTSIKGKDLSRDTAVAQGYMEDPLVYKSATVRLGNEFFKALEKTHSKLERINIPCLVISGENDTLMLGASEVYEKIGAQDKSLKIINEARHEVFNETEPSKSEALSELHMFLDKQL